MQFWKEGFKNILICIKWYVLEYMWNLHSWQLERQHLFKALQKKKKNTLNFIILPFFLNTESTILNVWISTEDNQVTKKRSVWEYGTAFKPVLVSLLIDFYK